MQLGPAFDGGGSVVARWRRQHQRRVEVAGAEEPGDGRRLGRRGLRDGRAQGSGRQNDGQGKGAHLADHWGSPQDLAVEARHCVTCGVSHCERRPTIVQRFTASPRVFQTVTFQDRTPRRSSVM